MKALYLKEASLEKMRPNSHKGYIQRLHRYADDNKEMTLSVFKDTGMIYLRNDYLKDNANFCEAELNADTKTIIVYIGCNIIECNSENIWSANVNGETVSNKDLKVVEEKVYNEYIHTIQE